MLHIAERHLTEMDKTGLQRFLARAEQRVTNGAHRIAQQEAFIAGIEQRGQDARLARRALLRFEAEQAAHLADRAQLRTRFSQAWLKGRA